MLKSIIQHTNGGLMDRMQGVNAIHTCHFTIYPPAYNLQSGRLIDLAPDNSILSPDDASTKSHLLLRVATTSSSLLEDLRVGLIERLGTEALLNRYVTLSK